MLDPCHPEHGTGVGFDTVHAGPDQWSGRGQLQIVVLLDVPDHLLHELLGSAPGVSSPGQFLFERAGFLQGFGGALLQVGDLIQNRSQSLGLVLDHDPGAILAQYSGFDVGLQSESLEQNRDLGPGPVKLDHFHAGLKQVHGQTHPFQYNVCRRFGSALNIAAFSGGSGLAWFTSEPHGPASLRIIVQRVCQTVAIGNSYDLKL